MYPSMQDPPTPSYSAEGHPGAIPASGIPDFIPTQPHPSHNPYIPPVPSAPVPVPVPGQWTSGLFYCFDDPVNCKQINTH